jgi:uncharacterized protein (DUF433 family)
MAQPYGRVRLMLHLKCCSWTRWSFKAFKRVIVFIMPRSVISISPDTLGGTPCFVGTRVPIKILFDYLASGDSLNVFLDQFPSVTRAAAVQLLRDCHTAVLEP